MFLSFGGVRSQAKDRTPSTALMGETHHGNRGQATLRLPIHRVQGGHSGRPAVPHHFNMVVDMVIQHWETRVAIEDACL